MSEAPARRGSIRPSWVAFGWFIAASVTGLVLFAAMAAGLADPAAGGSTWTLLAVVVGFAAGAFLTVRRAADSPIAHGLAIGGFSLVAWIVANVIGILVAGTRVWESLSLPETVVLLLVQVAAATVGAWLGRRRAHPG